MFCTSCGKQIDDDSLFCEFCGAKVLPFEPGPAAEPIAPTPMEPMAFGYEPVTPPASEPVAPTPIEPIPFSYEPVTQPTEPTMPLTEAESAPIVEPAAFSYGAEAPAATQKPEKKKKAAGGARAERSGQSKNLMIAGIAAAILLIGGIVIVALRGGFSAKAPGSGENADPNDPGTGETVVTPTEPSKPGDGDPTEPVIVTQGEPVWTGEWAASLPAGVNSENSLIRARLEYASTPLILQINDNTAPEGCKLYEDYRYGPYRIVTDYTDNWTSGTATANDWTEVRTQSSSGSGGGWKLTQDWRVYGYWDPGRSKPYPPVSSNSSTRVETRALQQTPQGSTPYEYRVFKYQGGSSTTVSSSQYRTREVEYAFYNDSAWGEWSESLIPQTGDVLVKYRVLYDYAPIEDGWTPTASLDNFPALAENYAGVFRDVDDNAWYGANQKNVLRTACSFGLLLPDGSMNFKPDAGVTIGQAIRAAVIINRIYNGADGGLLCENNGDYKPYVDYAVSTGMLDGGLFPELLKPATRQELAYILYHALPESEYPALREVSGVADMSAGRYYDCVLALAKAGVINLSDGSYRPDDEAKRAEAAGFIDALIYPAHRGR